MGDGLKGEAIARSGTTGSALNESCSASFTGEDFKNCESRGSTLCP